MSIETKIPAIDKAAWQAKIFAAVPRRSELLALKPDWPCRKISLRVHRNMPFEFVAGMLPPFLAYAGLEAEMNLSDYDDSLGFTAMEGRADCELVWLDYRRYEGRLDQDALLFWLEERLQALRALSDAPILVADGSGADQDFHERLASTLSAIPAIRIFPRHELENRLGPRWIDTRMQNTAAHTMSDEAVIATAQLLGLVWLPAAVNTALKAIVVDLDNTLFAGVLGEDGIDGIELSPAYRALQEKILEFKKRGLFLALLSRNERSDVENLFATRDDFPLRLADLSAVSIGWHDKSRGLQAIAEQLRIHPDAMLVIDDNLGEIAEMAMHHPTTAFWHVADPQLSIDALDLFPRLMRWHEDETDQLRIVDIEASKTRAALQFQIADPAAYVRSLGITLEFNLDPQHLRGRLTDLANKTNQFVLSLARFNETEVARRLNDPDCATFAVSLSDRLSDSGVIAAIFCRAEKQVLVVDEICISCRALGRHMETVMIITALRQAQKKLGTDDIAFAYNRGPRNDPARQWLEKTVGKPLLDEQGRVLVAWEQLCDKAQDLPVKITWGTAEKAA